MFRLIDKEVREMVNEAYKRAEQILLSKRDGLEKVAQVLLQREILKREDMVIQFGDMVERLG